MFFTDFTCEQLDHLDPNCINPPHQRVPMSLSRHSRDNSSHFTKGTCQNSPNCRIGGHHKTRDQQVIPNHHMLVHISSTFNRQKPKLQLIITPNHHPKRTLCRQSFQAFFPRHVCDSQLLQLIQAGHWNIIGNPLRPLVGGHQPIITIQTARNIH